MGASTAREGISGVVNELLIQLQSFDEPTTGARIRGWFLERLNILLRDELRVHNVRSSPANVLVVAATNRAADLDPALLRPGRFDRTIQFDLPGRAERRALIDYFLVRKAHAPVLDTDRARDDLAALTSGYSPVMIEHLFDEALVWALRRGGSALDQQDLQQAKLTEELGLRHPITYTDQERLAIATHEAGHATIAFLCGRDEEHPSPLRRLEVLSIIKRRGALGVLGHADDEERFTKSQSELLSLIRVAFGGMVGSARRVPAPDRRFWPRPRRWRRRWSARSVWADRCSRSAPTTSSPRCWTTTAAVMPPRRSSSRPRPMPPACCSRTGRSTTRCAACRRSEELRGEILEVIRRQVILETGWRPSIYTRCERVDRARPIGYTG